MRILKLCVGGFLGAALLQGSFAISAPAISSVAGSPADGQAVTIRSEEHTSELQSPI